MAGDDSSSDKNASKGEPARTGVPAAPLALYRRYRPATFAELKGQDHVTEPLRQALRTGRVNHAYLFSGPRGCGKTSSARILARSLNCEQGPTPDPCGVCESCVALAPSGPGSIDVIEIDAASHGGIDDARDLRERAFYAPVAARYKIYIIDEAHMVTGAGFNALLKLVEEPPPHLKFVFATTEPEKVIPTIRSRTHHYPFRLVPPAVLRELLEEILGNEGISYEPAVLPVVIRAGAGSVRDTLSVLDQLIAGADESGLRYDRAIALLGYTDDALLDEMAQAFAARDGAAVFGAIDHVVEAGHDPRRFAMDLLDRLRDLIVLAAVPDAAASGLLDVPEDQLERMREQVAGFGQDRLVRAAETISAGLVEMRGATSPRLLLELMCAQVLLPAAPAVGSGGPAGAAGLDDLAARLERLERQVSSGRARPGQPAEAPRDGEPRTTGARPEPPRAAPPPRSAEPASQRPEVQPPPAASQQAPSQPQRPQQPQSRSQQSQSAPESAAPAAAHGATGVLDAATLRNRWPDVLEAVREVRKTAWILLSNYASLDSVEGTVLTLGFDSEGNAKGFGSSGSDGYLADVIETMFGVRPVVRAIVQQAGRGGAPASRRGGDRPADDPVPGPQPGGGRSEPEKVRSVPDQGRSVPPGDLGRTDDGPSRAARSAASRDGGPGSRSAARSRGSGVNGSAGPRSEGRAANGTQAAGSSGGARSASHDIPDDPRPFTDAGPADVDDGLTGTDLIMRELGGRIIEEIGEP